jgi:hypothetical protein
VNCHKTLYVKILLISGSNITYLQHDFRHGGELFLIATIHNSCRDETAFFLVAIPHNSYRGNGHIVLEMVDTALFFFHQYHITLNTARYLIEAVSPKSRQGDRKRLAPRKERSLLLKSLCEGVAEISELF